jgi:hypothetical protein
MALRRNQRYLTAAEKNRFIKAVLALKAEIKPDNPLSTSGNRSYRQILVTEGVRRQRLELAI